MLRFQKVSDNLYRGSAPKLHEVSLLKDKYNVTKIISLDKESGLNIHQACEDNGINHIIIPIHGADDKDLYIIKKLGPTNIIGNEIAYVHCKHGKDRTGMFVAKYRVENGWDPQKALDEAVSFGFGTNMNKKDIIGFINLISKDLVSDKEIISMIRDNEKNLCQECGMVMHNNRCHNCMISEALSSMYKIIKFADTQEGVDKKLKSIVDEQREAPYAIQLDPEETLPGANAVSNTLSPEASTSFIPNMPSPEINNTMFGLASINVRKKILKAFMKAAVTQQLSYEIPKSEKKAIEKCITLLESLIQLEMSIYSKHLDAMYKPFKDYKGIKTDQLDKTQKYFDQYSNKLNDFLKNIKVKVLKCIEILQNFESDSDIYSMLKSLDELLDNLKLYQEMLDKTLKDEKTNDFQENCIKCLEQSKKELAQLKQLITERIVPYLNKNILGNNWSSDVKEDIIEDIKENKVEEKLEES